MALKASKADVNRSMEVEEAETGDTVALAIMIEEGRSMEGGGRRSGRRNEGG